MAKKKISFDLVLSNKIFKENLVSLLKASKETIDEQRNQYEELIEQLGKSKEIGDWFDKSCHYANIDWLFLNSVFISAFSFFEHHIFTFCRIVEEKFNKRIQLEDISGRGLFKYCNYLFLVGEIQSADKTKNDWQEIIYYQKVRNLIAHNGGIMLSDPSKQLEKHECFKFLEKYNVIMAGSLGIIRLTEITFIDNFRILTTKLSDNLTQELAYKIENNAATIL